jgi:hypothetical protein
MGEGPFGGIARLMIAANTRHVEPPGSPSVIRGRSRQQSRAARLAAATIAGIAAIPAVNGVQMLQARPPAGCFEWCDVAGGARLLIVVAAIAGGLAVGVWRRSLFPVAVGLCLAVTSSLIFGILLTAALVSGSLVLADSGHRVIVAGAGLSGLLVLLLVLALRDEIASAPPAIRHEVG